MKDWFYYVFYRASKFYEDWGESNGYIGGGVVAFTPVGFISLSIIIFVMRYLFNEQIGKNTVLTVILITSVLSFFLKEKKYEELAEKYKDEANSKRKGWLVFGYVLGSVLLYFVSMLICGYWVSIEI